MRTTHEAGHAQTLRTIEQAVRLEKLLELPATWAPKRIEMQRYIATYKTKVQAASSVRELPTEVGTSDQHNIAKFSRAPRTTPIGIWILKQRFKSGEILKSKLK